MFHWKGQVNIWFGVSEEVPGHLEPHLEMLGGRFFLPERLKHEPAAYA